MEESLSIEDHVKKADEAYAAAKRVREKQDNLEQTGKIIGKTTPEYLDLEHDLLSLMGFANFHANMACAKGIQAIMNRNVPVVFNGLAPGGAGLTPGLGGGNSE